MKISMSWLNDPITWGAYLKLAGIVAIPTAICYGIAMLYIYEPPVWEKFVSFIRNPFHKKENDK